MFNKIDAVEAMIADIRKAYEEGKLQGVVIGVVIDGKDTKIGSFTEQNAPFKVGCQMLGVLQHLSYNLSGALMIDGTR